VVQLSQSFRAMEVQASFAIKEHSFHGSQESDSYQPAFTCKNSNEKHNMKQNSHLVNHILD